jgi:hypothetical protein
MHESIITLDTDDDIEPLPVPVLRNRRPRNYYAAAGICAARVPMLRKLGKRDAARRFAERAEDHVVMAKVLRHEQPLTVAEFLLAKEEAAA